MAVNNFGGLSFAANDYQVADKNYEAELGAIQQDVQYWRANKQGIEQMSGFLSKLKTMDVDEGHKQQAITQFKETIDPFIKSGRYEKASLALSDAMNNYTNDEALAQSVGNYQSYMQLVQDVKESGYNEAEQTAYLKSLKDAYTSGGGVQVDEETGKVSGVFNNRSMGEVVNIQEYLMPFFKDFDKDVVDKVVGSFARGDIAGAMYRDKTLTVEQLNVNNAITHAMGALASNPEVQYAIETKQIANRSKSAISLNQSLSNSFDGNAPAVVRYQSTYNALNDEAKAKFDKENSIVNTDGSAIKDVDGKEVHKANYQVYSMANLLRAYGAGNADMTNAQLYNLYRNAIGQYEKWVGNADKITDPATKELYDQGVVFKDILNHSVPNQELRVEAYNAILPKTGVSETVKFSDWTDPGIVEMFKANLEREETELNKVIPVSANRSQAYQYGAGAAYFDNKKGGDIRDLDVYLKDKKLGVLESQKQLVGLLGSLSKEVRKFNNDIVDKWIKTVTEQEAGKDNPMDKEGIEMYARDRALNDPEWIDEIQGLDKYLNGEETLIDESALNSYIGVNPRALELLPREQRDNYYHYRTLFHRDYATYMSDKSIYDEAVNRGLEHVDAITDEAIDERALTIQRASMNSRYNERLTYEEAKVKAIEQLKDEQLKAAGKTTQANEYLKEAFKRGYMVTELSLDALRDFKTEDDFMGVVGHLNNLDELVTERIASKGLQYSVLGAEWSMGMSKETTGMDSQRLWGGFGKLNIKDLSVSKISYDPKLKSTVIYAKVSENGLLNSAEASDIRTIRIVDTGDLTNNLVYNLNRLTKANETGYDEVTMNALRAMSSDIDVSDKMDIEYIRHAVNTRDNHKADVRMVNPANNSYERFGTLTKHEGPVYDSEGNITEQGSDVGSYLRFSHMVESPDGGSKMEYIDFNSMSEFQNYMMKIYYSIRTGGATK